MGYDSVVINIDIGDLFQSNTEVGLLFNYFLIVNFQQDEAQPPPSKKAKKKGQLYHLHCLNESRSEKMVAHWELDKCVIDRTLLFHYDISSAREARGHEKMRETDHSL